MKKENRVTIGEIFIIFFTHVLLLEVICKIIEVFPLRM